MVFWAGAIGPSGQNRTGAIGVENPRLYPLSYRGEVGRPKPHPVQLVAATVSDARVFSRTRRSVITVR